MKFHYQGLSTSEVAKSRDDNGTNELPPPETETFFEKLKENYEDPLIRILMIALAITLLLAFLGYAEWYEGVGIFMAVFLATFVSTYSEYKKYERRFSSNNTTINQSINIDTFRCCGFFCSLTKFRSR
jgi:Ca2+-transporting ATPase